MKCLLCSQPAERQLEIKGLFKQYLCNKHCLLLERAIKDDYLYGSESLWFSK